MRKAKLGIRSKRKRLHSLGLPKHGVFEKNPYKAQLQRLVE